MTIGPDDIFLIIHIFLIVIYGPLPFNLNARRASIGTVWPKNSFLLNLNSIHITNTILSLDMSFNRASVVPKIKTLSLGSP